jgi:hypothetical protein
LLLSLSLSLSLSFSLSNYLCWIQIQILSLVWQLKSHCASVFLD